MYLQKKLNHQQTGSNALPPYGTFQTYGTGTHIIPKENQSDPGLDRLVNETNTSLL